MRTYGSYQERSQRLCYKRIDAGLRLEQLSLPALRIIAEHAGIEGQTKQDIIEMILIKLEN